MEAKAQKSGTKKARNRRKNSFSRPKAISKIILIALAALSIVAAVLYIFLGKPGKDEIEQVIDDGTILQGITVNGVDVAGMNYKQARDAVLPSVEEDLRSIHITVSHSTNMWLLTAADIKPSSTLDAAITEALTLGRGGTVIENAKEKDEIAQSGRDIPVTFVPNEAALKVRLAEIGGVLDSEPAEPYAVAVSSSAEPEFTFNEGVDGYMLDEDALYQNIASLLSAGQPLGMLPAGLGARDTLRTEMGYALHGHELSAEITPVMARMPGGRLAGLACSCAADDEMPSAHTAPRPR